MPTKDPSERLDYEVDWGTHWLVGEDTISSSSWVLSTIEDDASPLTLDVDSFTDTTATAWISGGTSGRRYTVTNHVATNAGREGERSFPITVKER